MTSMTEWFTAERIDMIEAIVAPIGVVLMILLLMIRSESEFGRRS